MKSRCCYLVMSAGRLVSWPEMHVGRRGRLLDVRPPKAVVEDDDALSLPETESSRS
jgi:hypothetical protein